MTLNSKEFSFIEWATLIENNFEKYYYIPLDATEDSNYEIDKKFIRKRGIYKDIVGCSNKAADY